MVTAIRKKLSESAGARWTVLILVSFTMLTGYIVSDVMAPLKTLLEQQLDWSASDYGIYTSGYAVFNVFLFMLIIGGMILDRKGPRFTGILAVFIMIAGTLVKYWALSTNFGDATTTLNLFGWEVFSVKRQVFYAMFGFAIFGIGIEMIGITANKVVVKWFTGRSLALALGLNVAAGRIGTAIALWGAYPYAKLAGTVSAPVALCLIMLVIGLLTFLVFIMIDRKADKELAMDGETQVAGDEEGGFSFASILSIVKIRAFWYIALLCVLFYAAIFPFIKFATDLMIHKFGVDTSWAGVIPGLIPFGNILLTPLFGSIYDRKGRGATIMIIGAVLLVIVHVLFAVPGLTEGWMAIVLMLLLGAAFSLVPSAMWPSVPKIIPYNRLGTAYSIIFWIQNIGLWSVPLLIGTVLSKYCNIGTVMIDGVETVAYDYSLPMMIFAGFGVLSVIVAILLRREDGIKNYGLERPNIKEQGECL